MRAFGMMSAAYALGEWFANRLFDCQNDQDLDELLAECWVHEEVKRHRNHMLLIADRIATRRRELWRLAALKTIREGIDV
jgi:hypothetical protein